MKKTKSTNAKYCGTSKNKVLCIGSMGKDVFFPVSSGMVMESGDEQGKTKQFCFRYGGKVHVEDRFSALGGCACNVSIGLSRLGIDVSAFGNVGDDYDGKWIKKILDDEHVNIKNINTVQKGDTDMSVIIVDSNVGERTIFVNRDVGEKMVLKTEDVGGFDWCFVGSLYGEHIESNMKVIHDALLQTNLKLVYNPGGKNIKQDENIVLDLIHHASLVFVNKMEAREIVSKFDLSYTEEELSDEQYLLATIKEHMQDETGVVVVTDGRLGAWAYDGKNTYHTDTIDKPVHDATGAGDAFASGFFAGILYKLPLDKCIQWGSVNGDAVVDYYGAQKGLQTCGIIQERTELFVVENKKKK